MLAQKGFIPVVPRWKTFANAARFLRNPIPVIDHNIELYGRTYAFYLGGMYPAIFTSDPAFMQHVLQKQHRRYRKSPAHFDILAHYLGHGLLTSEGELWLRQRRLIQPGFHRRRLAGLTGLMTDVIDEFCEAFDRDLAAGPVDMHRKMLELTFAIIARSIFSANFPADKLDRLSELLTALQEIVVKQIRQPFLNPWLRLSGKVKAHEKLAAETDVLLQTYIDRRRQSDVVHHDLLQMLLEARYEDTGEPMSERQLLDEVKILIVAGHETSANALAWCWRLLGQHPEVVRKLREEHDRVLGDQRPDFSHLPRLTYTLQVIEESMRLYPPAWITDRMAIQDDEFEGIPIPKGMYIVTYFYGAHRDPAFWEAPEAFRPERFAPELKKEHVPYSYLPFGGGPRLCIGNNFALMEMQLALAAMVRRYDLRPADDQPVEMLPLITLRPKGAIWME